MSKHVALYVRVSSGDQSQESQLPELKRWAEGQAEPVQWYKDKATGKTMEREAFSKLATAIANGEVSKVVVWRLDRLGRTARGLTALFEDLQAKGVGFVSLRDSLDLATPAGRLMANVLASVAQYETEVRSERQLAGIEAAKAQGVKFGRPEGKGKRLKVTPEQEALIGRLKAEGQKVAAIARSTGLSRPTIYAVLDDQNPSH